jgi:hypothetical protein
MSARTATAMKPSVHGLRWLLVGGMALTMGVSACNTDADTTSPTADPSATTASATAQSTPGATLVRLTNREYDNAVQDILGVPGLAQSTFPTDSVATLGDDRFEQYFDAAESLGEQVWSNPYLKARLMTCTPSEDSACTRQIVTNLGSRAFHGPMAPVDVDRLTKVATDAVALGETPADSIKQVVKTMLASPQFLYTVTPAL